MQSRVACSTCGRPGIGGQPCPHCGSATPATSVGEASTFDGGPIPAAMPAPSTLGRFSVRGRLGEGAFGVVYRAVDPRLDREVALKVAKATASGSDRRTRRFLREARAAANLRHPNVVPLYEAGQEGELLYIASAFIAGRTLQAELAETDGPLPVRRAAFVARRLAEALGYAHSQGIVHRDVKPANIMVDEHGEPLVMDFGLAARAEEAAELTQEGAAIGTPRYMSPEQAAGRSAEAGPAADQYAVGVVLYEMLAGQPPFEGPTPQVIYHHVHTEPVPVRSANPSIPRDLDTICRKCLRKDPADRYASCAELADDLRRWLDGEPIRARQLSPPEVAWRFARRNPMLAAVGAVAVFALLAVAAISSISASEQRRLANDARSKQADAEREATRANNAEIAERARAEEARLAAKRAAEAETTVRGQNVELAARLEEARRRSANDETILARRDWLADDLPSATARLAALADSPYRSWEVDYLRRAMASLRLAGREGGQPTATHVGWSPDGSRIAAARSDGSVLVWDAGTGRLERALLGPAIVAVSLAFGPRPGQLAVCGADGVVRLWDVRDGKSTGELRLSRAGEQLPVDVAFDPEGGRLAVAVFMPPRGGPGGPPRSRVGVFDLATGEEKVVIAPREGRLTAVAWAAKGGWLAAVGLSGVQLCRPDGGDPANLDVPDTALRGVAFSPDGKLLAAGSEVGVVRVWDVGRGREVLTLAGSPLGTGRPAFSPDGRRLACGTGRSVTVWDAATGRELFALRANEGNVLTVAWSSDGTRLAACGGGIGAGGEVAPGDLRVWSAIGSPATEVRRVAPKQAPGGGRRRPYITLDAGGRIARAEGMEVRLSDGPAPPDGSRGRTATLDKGRLVVKDAGGAVLWEVPPPPTPGLAPPPLPPALAWSPDGKRLATARVAFNEPGEVAVRDATDGKPLFTVPIAPGWASLAFSDDGRRLAVAEDGAVRVFDPVTGQETATFPAPGLGGEPAVMPMEIIHRRFAFTGVAFSGGVLTAACTDGQVYRWGAVGPEEPKPPPPPAVLLFAPNSPSGSLLDPRMQVQPDSALGVASPVRKVLESLARRNVRTCLEVADLPPGAADAPVTVPPGRATVGDWLAALAAATGGQWRAEGAWARIGP